MRCTHRRVVHADGTREWVPIDDGMVAGPKFGEGSDYYKGVKPSDLKQLDGSQLYMTANRIATTLSEGRGTTQEINNARDAYSSVIREAKSRRSLHH